LFACLRAFTAEGHGARSPGRQNNIAKIVMKLGPVLSGTYNLIKQSEQFNTWTEHIKKSGFDVELISDPGTDELSRAVVTILDKVFEAHGYKGGCRRIGLECRQMIQMAEFHRKNWQIPANLQ